MITSTHKLLRAAGGVILALAAAGPFSVAQAANPQPVSPDIVAGFEGGRSASYAFISPTFGIALDENHDLLFKPSVHYLKYQTQQNGVDIPVRSPGASFGISYRFHGPKFTLDIGPSVEFIHEERDIPTGMASTGTPASDDKIGLAVSANAFYQTDPSSTLSLITNYSQTSHYFFSRVGFKTRISNRDYKGPIGIAIGPELTGQGGQGARQYGAGAMIEVGLDKAATSLQLRGGYTRVNFANGTLNSYPYFGAGLYHRF